MCVQQSMQINKTQTESCRLDGKHRCILLCLRPGHLVLLRHIRQNHWWRSVLIHSHVSSYSLIVIWNSYQHVSSGKKNILTKHSEVKLGHTFPFTETSFQLSMSEKKWQFWCQASMKTICHKFGVSFWKYWQGLEVFTPVSVTACGSHKAFDSVRSKNDFWCQFCCPSDSMVCINSSTHCQTDSLWWHESFVRWPNSYSILFA